MAIRPRVGLMKSILWRAGVHQTILKTIVWQSDPALGLEYCTLESRCSPGNDAPHWVYGICTLESRCSPKHIKKYCLAIRPRIGLIKIELWRSGVRQTIFKNYCLAIRPRIGLMKIVLWRAGVRPTIFTNIVWQSDPWQ